MITLPNKWIGRLGMTLALTIGGGIGSPLHAADQLYVGDISNNSVNTFDASTGDFLGAAVKSLAGLHGPRGIVVNPDGNLLVSDQNALTSTRGDVLLYSSATGKLLQRIVSHNDPGAPVVPRGIILWEDTLFVANFASESSNNIKKPTTPGQLLAYTTAGVTDLTPEPVTEFPPAPVPGEPVVEFHPRAVVIGPDGFLYVSNYPTLTGEGAGLGGQVLRFDPDTGYFVDVFINSTGGAGELNRPEGLVFGPDGKLYITSFRMNAPLPTDPPIDVDSIRIYNGTTGAFLDKIELNPLGQPRAFAQALLFGPGGSLFVPISGGSHAGSVRRYNVASKAFTAFVLSSASGGPLGEPWYLSFGKTNSATLGYDE